VICGPDFNQTIPNAGTTCRMGWCHGFEQLGIPYLLMSVFDIAKRLPELPDPICWISGSDYLYLNRSNLESLKKYKHIVWVNTWFDDQVDFYRRNRFRNNSFSDRINKKILSSEPTFVFTISPKCSFEYYHQWIQHGANLVSLPLACDSTSYRNDAPFCPEFAEVEMAFVGGYWRYKTRQFDRYLKPYQDRLKVYGYSVWPYAGYGGRLSESKEPSLYCQARLSPTINEPHVELMGIDLNERVFKVLGSGGITITDVTPAYREWFAENELLVPTSLGDFHDMVRQVLSDENLNLRYRQQGYQAVISRHTYAHRAKVALSILNSNEV